MGGLALTQHIELIQMNSELLEGKGSYCLRSKKKTEGYQNKNKWLNQQFEKGLHYIQVLENQKQVGFIEYTDAEYSSRVVHADGYVVIHCLWVSAIGQGLWYTITEEMLKGCQGTWKKGSDGHYE